jgi:hypothetical protein
MRHPIQARRAIRSIGCALGLLLCAAGTAAADGGTCGSQPMEPCPCGKLPVCVFSGHGDGLFSQITLGSSGTSPWSGFGPDAEDTYVEAMIIEDQMAERLEKANPCLEILRMDSYQFRSFVVDEMMEQAGLLDRLRAAREAKDEARVAEVLREIDALFEAWGLGDLPWQNMELMKVHVQGRMTGCIGQVYLSGASQEGQYAIHAEAAVPMAGMENQTHSVIAGGSRNGVKALAGLVAGQLATAHQKLFCGCLKTDWHCVTTDFNLAGQKHQCTYTEDCCGEVTTRTEDGDGLRAGGGHEYEATCCSPMAKARESAAEEDRESRELLNELWCPGTWNLKFRDLDCDGVPNADDPTPVPADPPPAAPAP